MIIVELVYRPERITMRKRLLSRIRVNKRGQSFVELMLVVLILAFMLSGVVEFGMLLNDYLKVLDGAREGARFSSSSIAFNPATGSSYQLFYVNAAIESLRVMSPIDLNGNRGDDLLVSVFSVAGSSITRYPLGYAFGWSLCANYNDALLRTTMAANLTLDQYNAFIAGWSACTVRHSHFTTGQVLSNMDSSAPGSGVLLVEVYFNYPQMLKLPVFEQVIPDPIPVYTYSIMPISSAEPTATPGH